MTEKKPAKSQNTTEATPKGPRNLTAERMLGHVESKQASGHITEADAEKLKAVAKGMQA